MKKLSFVVLTILCLLCLQSIAFSQAAQYIPLANQVTATGSQSGINQFFTVKDVKEVTVAFKIASADRTTGDETYDLYITTGIRLPDGTFAKWDIAHFPQIAATGVKTYVATIKGYGVPYPSTITTAGPGVAAINTGTMKTDTAAAAEGIKSLTAGMVRHGVLGEFISYELVCAGTTPILGFSVSAVAK
jgi:hypothetical protein